jgi:hypothetical protein
LPRAHATTWIAITGAQGRARVTNHRHLLTLAGAAVAALVLALLVLPPGTAAAKPKKSLSQKKLRSERRRLARDLRRHPSSILRPGFLHKAQVLGLNLPLTVRLNRAVDQGPAFLPTDDQVEITWNDDTAMWPGGFSMLSPAAAIDVGLTGGFRADADFGADTSGYGQAGIVETILGQQASLDGASGLPADVSDLDPACGSASLRIDALTLGAGEATRGTLDLLNGKARGTLHLTAAVASSVQTTCGGGWEPTDPYTSTGGPFIPLKFDGAFRMSPALTADGRMRLGTISVSDARSPQASNFALIAMCTVPAGGGCTPQSFPARLTIKTLTAEVLLGQVPL